MRKVLRNKHSSEYWDNRWASFENDRASFKNMNIYPIRFVENVINDKKNILDAGCGLGRIVKHYDNIGYNIFGCELSESAIKKLKKNEKELKIKQGSITKLPYKNEEFDLIVAFGVIHSIELINEIHKAFQECHRCLQPDGIFVFSARADNWENYFIDKITNLRGKKGNKFHKWCFKGKELKNISKNNKFEILKIQLVSNVPFLHKFKCFRKQNNLNEGELRSKGFELNFIGRFLYGILKFVFPRKFGTTYVFTTKKCN